MDSNYLYSTDLSQYRPLLWSGGHVFKQYALIKNYLKTNLGEGISDLFSIPQISDNDLIEGNKVSWTCESMSNKALPFTHLSDENKKKFQTILDEKAYALKIHINILLQSSDSENQHWGNLLQQVLKIPSFDCILIDDEKICLVLWSFEGLNPKNKQPQSINLISPERNQSNSNPELFKINDEKIKSSNIGSNEIVIEDNTRNGEFSSERKIDGTQTHESRDESGDSNSQHRKDKSDNLLKEDFTVSSQNNDKGNVENYKVINTGGSRKKILWLLFFLFIIYFVYFIYNEKKQEIKYLPVKNADIVLIDTTKIIKNPNGVNTIVSDRINIALLGNNKSIVSFSKAFKNEYPDENFRIIYYDTNIHRIQISVPSEEREMVKNTIDKKIKGFELLVWDETIFQNNRTFNDPVFNDIDYSWYIKSINAEDAWDKTLGDSNLVVAIIDDGFDLRNPDFANKIYKPRNIPEGNNRITTNNASPHGTHVAGTSIANSNNRFGSTGIAPNCKFMPIQVWDKNGVVSQTYIIDGILYAINNGASVINLSLGTELNRSVCNLSQSQQEELVNNQFKSEEKFWNMLFKEAYDKNVTVVMAAGNDNIMTGVDPFQRSKYTIKVSAVDTELKKASFSNYGNHSTISAPGVAIYNVAPNGQMAFLEGTSMASPMVAGAVALIKSIHPAYSFEEIVNVLQSTGLPVGSSQQPIGNLIQLDKALEVVKNSREQETIADCSDIQHQIDSLNLRIKKLQNKCRDN